MINLHQGKALGGSSALNAHVFVPPAKGTIDSWETLGNKGWNWNDLKTHLSKVYTKPTVDQADEKALGIDGWAGTNDAAKGPIQTSFCGDISHPVREAWATSFKHNGHYMPEDPFLNGSIGSFSCLATIDPVKKERSYSANAYYNPIEGRDNLQVLTNAHVEKVLTQKDGGAAKATGVQFTHDGESKTILANKEVIIAAGVFQSPKLLELSGIGEKELLNKHGIDVVEHLPGVGEGLHDHAIAYTGFKAVDNVATLDSLIRQEPEALQQAMQEYGATQSGPLTSCGVYSYAYLPVLEHASDESQKALKALLEQNRPAPGSSPEEARATAFYNVAETTLLDQQEPSGAYVSALAQITIPLDANAEKPPAALPGKFITIGSMLSQPLSRGSVHIRSKDPSAQPIIDPNYLSHPIDVEIMAHHILQTKKIAGLAPFNNLLQKPLTHRDPAADFTDLEAAKAYARRNAISMWHLGGTCAMLPKEKAGVVDTSLKVYGVENLRVVDASAIPLISTANLQATVYAFAEKAADIIKDDWSTS